MLGARRGGEGDHFSGKRDEMLQRRGDEMLRGGMVDILCRRKYAMAGAPRFFSQLITSCSKLEARVMHRLVRRLEPFPCLGTPGREEVGTAFTDKAGWDGWDR